MSGGASATTIAALSIAAAASAAGAGVGAYSAIQSGEAASASAKYQAQVADNNAIIAGQNAQYAEQQGVVQEQEQRQKTAAFVGAQLAGQAANGLDVNSGTDVSLRQSSSELGEEDALTIRSNTAHNVQAYENQASSSTDQAQLDTFDSTQSQLAGFISATGSIVGGAGSIAGMGSNAGMHGINIMGS